MLRASLAAAVAVLLVVPAAASAGIGAPTTHTAGVGSPWEVVLLPDGQTTWVTERSPCRVIAVPAKTVVHQGGGECHKVLGLELHPGFVENRLAYLYETYDAGAVNRSRVVRLRETGGRLVREAVVLDGIGSDLSHDGGRVRFGPDGKLYVTTGDIHDPSTPQDVTKANGKVLRLNAPGGAGDGTAPADNPFAGQAGFAPFVWSYGHRHPQGLAFDSAGRLWESEHGPSGEAHAPEGAKSGRDEVNLIVRGGNYGWPLVAGTQTREGTIAPAAVAGAEAWAPGGAAIGSDGALYVPELAGRGLLRFPVTCAGLGAGVELLGDRGQRLRAATVGRDALWLTTDGVSGGDQVLRAPMDAEGFTGLSCGGPAPSSPGGPGTTTAPPSSTTPTTPAPGPATCSPASGAAACAKPELVRLRDQLTTLLGRVRTVVRRDGASKLLSRRGVTARVGGLGAGTLTVRVSLRGARGRTTRLALATVRSTSRGTVTVRLRMGRAARRALAGRRTASLGLLARFVPADRPGADAALRLRVRR